MLQPSDEPWMVISDDYNFLCGTQITKSKHMHNAANLFIIWINGYWKILRGFKIEYVIDCFS